MQRYSTIFRLKDTLFMEDCPVLIKAGALLKDHHTGQLLAQLKFQNTSDREIREVCVTVQPCDAEGAPLCTATHSYAKLSEKPYSEFGQTTAVPLDAQAYSFQVRIDSVSFADGTAWQPGNPEFSRQITKEQQSAMQKIERDAHLQKNRLALQKMAFLPLGLAVLAIILEIIRICTVNTHNPHATEAILTSLRVGWYLIGLILPAGCLLLFKKPFPEKISVIGGRVSFGAAALQLLCAILYFILLMSGVNYAIVKFFTINGYPLISPLFTLFRGNFNILGILSLLSSVCYIGKNVLCGILLKKLTEK